MGTPGVYPVRILKIFTCSLLPSSSVSFDYSALPFLSLISVLQLLHLSFWCSLVFVVSHLLRLGSFFPVLCCIFLTFRLWCNVSLSAVLASTRSSSSSFFSVRVSGLFVSSFLSMVVKELNESVRKALLLSDFMWIVLP
jgi:hypothetical protein